MSYSLLSKLRGVPVTKTVELADPKLTVELRLLNGREDAEIASRLPNLEIMSFTQLARVPTLAKAIQSIDDQPLLKSDEALEFKRANDKASDVQILEHVVGLFPTSILAMLHQEYLQMIMDHRKTLDELKKTSTRTTRDSSGE